MPGTVVAPAGAVVVGPVAAVVAVVPGAPATVELVAPGTPVDGALALLDALCARPSEGAWRAVCRYLLSQPDAARLVPAAEG
ncbi:MAG: hypothetical protein ACLGIK_00675, partial [Gemmatimonadota bacterium]